MKYIKIFESFEGYVEIPYSELPFESGNNNTEEAFTEKEINYIKDITNCKVEYRNSILIIYGKKWEYEDCLIARIHKQEDEWYYLSVLFIMPPHSRRMYYKCDQFDSLIKCIKDNNLNIF